MARLLDQRTAIALMEAAGWERRTGGRHVVKMVKPGARPVTLPHHRGASYGKGLTHAIIRQADLATKDENWNSRSTRTQRERGTGRRSGSSRDASPPHDR